MRLVSAYRGVPWAVLVDGGTCKPTWSNGGFALSRFVPECALTHCEARLGICSAPLTIRSQHSAPLAADRGVRTATPALRHARTLLEALPAVSALAAAASASAAPDLEASRPMRVPSTGSSKADATALGARCKSRSAGVGLVVGERMHLAQSELRPQHACTRMHNIFWGEAILMMELPKRHATPLYGQPARTHTRLHDEVIECGTGGFRASAVSRSFKCRQAWWSH